MTHDIQFDILQTGSSGNSMILNGILALDCGVPYSKIAPYIKGLQLIWVGHCHGDHFKESTIRKIAIERPSARFAGGAFMVEHFIRAGVPARQIDVLEAGKRYNYGLFQIEPVTLYHDVENHGLKIFMCGKRAIYAVDTGYIDHVQAEGFDYFYLESNHTRAEIEERIAEKQARGEFAYESRAAQNHLSQEQAMDWLARNAGPNSKYIPLHQHRERTNNDG